MLATSKAELQELVPHTARRRTVTRLKAPILCEGTLAHPMGKLPALSLQFLMSADERTVYWLSLAGANAARLLRRRALEAGLE